MSYTCLLSGVDLALYNQDAGAVCRKAIAVNANLGLMYTDLVYVIYVGYFDLLIQVGATMCDVYIVHDLI